MENNKHLVRVGHEFAAAMSDDTPIITIAKMVTELASALDVQTARSEALAAENAGLKAGASYFSYGSEHNFEWHKTAEEAVEAAEAAIDDYRGDACDGWSEEVDSVCWGIIMQSSTKVGERPRNEDDRCDPAINTICDYALLPNVETPVTDAFLAEVRAQGVELVADHLETLRPNLTYSPNSIRDYAAQIRSGMFDDAQRGNSNGGAL